MRRYILILLFIIVVVLTLRLTDGGEGLAFKWEQQNFWLKKANTKGKYDLLVLGDSRGYHSVNPDLLKNREDQKVLNFAFSSMSLTPYYLEKSDQLLNEKSLVIIMLTAESLTTFESDKHLRANEKGGPLFIHQFLALVRTYWLQINLQLALKQGRPLRQLTVGPDNAIHHENGWIESSRAVQERMDSMVHHYKELSQKFQLDPQILNGLKAQIGAWTQNGKQVYLMWTCFEAIVCAEETPILPPSRKQQIEAELSMVGARFLNVPGTYQTFDGDHLTGPEAIRFSQELGKILQQQAVPIAAE